MAWLTLFSYCAAGIMHKLHFGHVVRLVVVPAGVVQTAKIKQRRRTAAVYNAQILWVAEETVGQSEQLMLVVPSRRENVRLLGADGAEFRRGVGLFDGIALCHRVLHCVITCHDVAECSTTLAPHRAVAAALRRCRGTWQREVCVVQVVSTTKSTNKNRNPNLNDLYNSVYAFLISQLANGLRPILQGPYVSGSSNMINNYQAQKRAFVYTTT